MKPADTTPATAPRGTGVAPLLYWLAVICGLGGITILRLDDLRSVVPLWFGAITGIATGQLLGLLRIRIWAIVTIGFMLSWFLIPLALFLLSIMFGTDRGLADVLFAFAPAAICGYASLSERGGLVAFWYPAMLWMLVILDGAVPGTFSAKASLPLVVGLAALFVAFLRARESRRAALWQALSTVRLATPAPRTVLRASPLRGMGQLAWTAMAGAGALLIAAWIAPKLWQKDIEVHHRETAIAQPPPYDKETGFPCCPESKYESEHIREYIPLRHEQPHAPQGYDPTCSECRFAAPAERIEMYASGPGAGIRAVNEHWTRLPSWALDAPYDDRYGGGYAQGGYAAGDPNNGAGTTPVYDPWGTGTGTTTVPTTPAPTPHTTQPPITQPPIVAPKPKPVIQVSVAVKAPAPVAVKTPPTVPTKAPDPGTPWGLLLPLLVSALALPLATRFTRRQLTLRHLARPFWRESIDQRISNHWQRILVGLRDAGVHIRTNEQPQAFAKRVGIDGMTECATILERVRHGVRVEADDVRAMDRAATTIYRTARGRAGVAGRVAGAFRWPLV